MITALALVSCKNEKPKTPKEPEGIPIVKSVSKVINKRDFPLKNFSKIELVSYYDRIMWDTVKYKGEQPFRKVLVDNYKLTFDSTMIQERVILNKIQEKELLNLVVCDTCVPEEISAACYRPRHMILFRDNKNRIVAYNEFCISCNGSRNSANIDGFQKYCLYEMGDLFKKFGIKLFIDYDDEQKEYDILRKKGY
ncbi:hypothetical protein SAMN05444671_1248 [Flavobacterium sp. CF108]|nr:hypothetical protein SAMN04487978_3805 [Flavobacterium sp. fv08]SHG70685.1 hypothetical protein SAMN05444671_1248 [Flavobacterium sp. CF108]